MNTQFPGSQKPENARYCVLAYRPGNGDEKPLPEASTVAIAVRGPGGALSIHIHPHWKDIAQPADRRYLSELFEDFRQRAGRDPEGLFQQLCDLSVGPLVAVSAGVDLACQPGVQALCLEFVDIDAG